jgi:E3 ubiquitin-protein ligase RAD18
VWVFANRYNSSKTRTPPPPRDTAPLNVSPTKQLSHLNYNFLKDRDLKKKLQEQGIPAFGSRQLLMRRYTQWVDIFNANLDSPRPRSNRELLKELDTWERTQGGHAPNQGQVVPTGVMKKDFDGAEWSGKHRSHFDDLVAKARAKVASRPKEDEGETTTKEISTNGESTTPLTPPESSTVLNEEEQKTDITSLSSNGHDAPVPPVVSILSTAAHEIQARYTSPPISCSEPHSLQINPSASSSPIPLRRSESDKLVSAEKLKRMPLFQVPEDPVTDIEGLGGGGST